MSVMLTVPGGSSAGMYGQSCFLPSDAIAAAACPSRRLIFRTDQS
jgi:hypothetical protein